MNKLKRYMGYDSDVECVCLDSDVARIEASHAEFEAKCAELQRLLDSYIEAFDVMNDSMTWAHRIIADPESIAVIDLPTESMVAKNAELLEALKQIFLQTDGRNSSHIGQFRAWEIARAAIAKAEGVMP